MKRHLILPFVAFLSLTVLFPARALGDELARRIPSDCAPHPRLLLAAGEEAMVLRAVENDSTLARFHQAILDYSTAALDREPVRRIMAGKRLLHVSREALQRIFCLSYAFRMTGEQRYADRAVREMLACSGFSDWNPSHFLDVGEMTMALAIGYDWLYDRISPEARATIRSAIVQKGLLPAENQTWAHFYRGSNNWNQVCNAGLVYGALAVREEAPVLSDTVIVRCLRTNPRSLKQYSPEGCYPEGYGYWKYGSSFQVLLVAALESAFGSDLGLLEGYDGFLRSARFMQFMSTPTGGCFNYYDSGNRAAFTLVQPWMAFKTGDTSLLYPEFYLLRHFGYPKSDEDRLLPLVTIYGARLGMGTPGFRVPAPAGHVFVCGGHVPLFLFRSGWDSPEDTYLGIKGGRGDDSHGHVDAGSFIFEEDGVRWASDLGNQDYLSLEERGVDLWNARQDSQRWEVFRVGPWSHNILTVNGHCPLVGGKAELRRHWDGKRRTGAEFDITAPLKEDLDTALRRVWLDRRGTLHVEDAVRAGKEDALVRWAMCTPASVEQVDARTFRLSSGDQVRLLRVRGRGAVLRTWTTEHMHDYDAPNPGYTMVGFEMPVRSGKPARSRVTLSRR